MFVIAKRLAHIKNNKLMQSDIEKNWFHYNYNQLAAVIVCKMCDYLPNGLEV